MDKTEELKKLEKEKEALQEKIDLLKKSTGQLKFEELIHRFNTSSTYNSFGFSSINIDGIEISMPTIHDKENYYELMYNAVYSLCRLCGYINEVE